jgi:3-dehydroquinate dehydratase-2
MNMKILIVNGPNLNLLGQREPQIYGNVTFEDYLKELNSIFNFQIDYFQSNIEGELINIIQESKHDGIILNAGGYSHTSVALRDCVSAIEVPVIEVHISNLSKRESFRHNSLISPVAVGSIMGFGIIGYQLALNYFVINRR